MQELGRILDQMEEKGIISKWDGNKPRTILISREKWIPFSLDKRYYDIIDELNNI